MLKNPDISHQNKFNLNKYSRLNESQNMYEMNTYMLSYTVINKSYE